MRGWGGGGGETRAGEMTVSQPWSVTAEVGTTKKEVRWPHTRAHAGMTTVPPWLGSNRRRRYHQITRATPHGPGPRAGQVKLVRSSEPVGGADGISTNATAQPLRCRALANEMRCWCCSCWCRRQRGMADPPRVRVPLN